MPPASHDGFEETNSSRSRRPECSGRRNFEDMAEIVAAGGPPDPAALGAVMRRHGLTPAPPAQGA